MKKQLIISIGREYGSGGHAIAKILSEKFGIPLYDHNLLDEIAADKNIAAHELKQYDEAPKKHLWARSVKGYNNSPEENVAYLQFNYMQKMADDGKSFVIVGRCAEYALKECPALISIFVLADRKTKIERICKVRDMTKEQAAAAMYRHDKHRKSYHNYYCENKWGDSRGYELSVNSSKLGVERTAEIIELYIRKRIEDM